MSSSELVGGVRGRAGWQRASAAAVWSDAAKRSFDVLASASALVLLSPLFLAIAIAVRLDSPGPVFFSHRRVGMNRRGRRERAARHAGERRTRSAYGPEFEMLKFRTMRLEAEPYAVSPTTSEDPRITRVGRMLRRTCLDELPQLLNVLRGEMSLVGPRPEMPFIVAGYDSVQRERLEAPAGLTGLWQVRGPRDRHIHDSIEWDLEYISTRSFRRDILILAETLRFAFRRKNR